MERKCDGATVQYDSAMVQCDGTTVQCDGAAVQCDGATVQCDGPRQAVDLRTFAPRTGPSYLVPDLRTSYWTFAPRTVAPIAPYIPFSLTNAA